MSRIELRIHPSEKDALQRAADAAGMTLSGYVRYKLEAPLPDFRIAQQLGAIMHHHQQSDLQEIALVLEDLRQQISQLSEQLLATLRPDSPTSALPEKIGNDPTAHQAT